MSSQLAIVAGTSLLDTKLFSGYRKVIIKNKYGKVIIYRRNNIIFIQRHQGNLPPHRINYQAYYQALADEKVKQVITITSAGSLSKRLKVPALLVPDDFICPWQIPTFFDKEIKHITPGFSERLRAVLIKAAKELKIKVKYGGVYLQALGPRLETSAEIRMFASFADIVGMTLASEATLVCEKGLELAALCTVDNYANGVAGKIDYDLIRQGARRNQREVERILTRIIRNHE